MRFFNGNLIGLLDYDNFGLRGNFEIYGRLIRGNLEGIERSRTVEVMKNSLMILRVRIL